MNAIINSELVQGVYMTGKIHKRQPDQRKVLPQGGVGVLTFPPATFMQGYMQQNVYVRRLCLPAHHRVSL